MNIDVKYLRRAVRLLPRNMVFSFLRLAQKIISMLMMLFLLPPLPFIKRLKQEIWIYLASVMASRLVHPPIPSPCWTTPLRKRGRHVVNHIPALLFVLHPSSSPNSNTHIHPPTHTHIHARTPHTHTRPSEAIPSRPAPPSRFYSVLARSWSRRHLPHPQLDVN